MMITVKVEEYTSNRRLISCTAILFFLILLAGFIVVDLIRFSILLVVGELLVLTLLIVLMGFALRDPPGTLRVLAGAGLLVAFSIPLFIELTAKQPVFPANFPEEVLSLPLIQENRVLTDGPTQFMIIYEPDIPIELQIDFEKLDSLDGLWAYNKAGVTIEGVLNGFYEANPSSHKVKSWNLATLFRSGIPLQEFTPDFKVSLPIAEEYLHQWITIRAEMDVLFPSVSESGTVEIGPDQEVANYEMVETTKNITRQFKVFIGSPEDVKLRAQYAYWQKWKDLHTHFPGTTARMLVTIIGGILLVWGGIEVLKAIKEIMPGLSILKWPELGLELADTSDVAARKGIQLPGVRLRPILPQRVTAKAHQ